ncbi:hypothetical protein ACGFZK_21260 [Streptomyces sp. NPDC048257]|uniref:hypothetical protein n=1 Tax=Streptomyces sp. NPDC048257 TaxID=3365526 RepID=UPI00371AC947
MERAHWIQRVLAAVALLAAVRVPLANDFLRPTVMAAVATAVPLLLLHHQRAFSRTCAVIGFTLLAWGFCALFSGMAAFWPSALLLLAAALGNPGRGTYG